VIYTIETAQIDTIEKRVVATGKVEPRDEVLIKPQIAGIISEVNKEAGEMVSVGDVIAIVQVVPSMDALTSAEYRVNVATIGVEQTRREHERVKELYGNGVIAREAFEQSSNIGFARSVLARFEDSAGRFVDFLRDSLHMGGTTGIDLPLERASDIKHPVRQKERWDGVSLQMMAYGYALEVTPLQTLTLYNAVANGGLMVRPRIVRQVRNYGEVVRQTETDTIGMIASPGTVAAVQRALAGVVEAGTGRLVMEGASYSAVAKTGTAQQVLEGGRGYRWADGSLDILATFVGYFPIEKPKYSCIVAIKLHEPRGKRYYGSNVAGPVFRAVADRLYARAIELHGKTYDGPVTEPAEIKRRYWEPFVNNSAADSLAAAERKDASVPWVVGMGLGDALYVLEQAGFRTSFSGTGAVAEQYTDSTGVRLVLRRGKY
jgi:cell division protein FtsI (penicillin-binding protein 3)